MPEIAFGGTPLIMLVVILRPCVRYIMTGDTYMAGYTCISGTPDLGQ